jgi:glycosyltransferase involved in cell wall biosynthesis
MKVLRVIARLNTGGPARHVILLNQGLRERGHETLLVHGQVGPGEGSLESLAGEASLRTERLGELGPRVRPLDDCRALLKLVKLVFDEQPDVIHTHTAKAGALGRLAALIFNATRRRDRQSLVVHTFHGHVFSGYFGGPATALVRFAERRLAAVTDRVVTISPAQRNDIVSRFRIAADAKTVVVPLGLDLQALLCQGPSAPTLRARLGLSDAELVVGYVGRFVPIKDLPTLIHAFALLLKSVPAATLVMAGDGPVRAELEALVEELHLRDRVRFLGWSTALGALYATFDICAMSSRNEGTPVAIIEAMAAARPVVATRVGGVPDVVEDGFTGLLVPAADPEALARALLVLANDPDRRRALGQAARASVAARFTPGRLVDDIDLLYSRALGEKRGVVIPC